LGKLQLRAINFNVFERVNSEFPKDTKLQKTHRIFII